MEGIVFGESPRWHDGQVWFSDWGAHQVIALGSDGSHEVVATVELFPMCIDFLPDGRLLIVDSAQRRLLRRELDGSLVPHADRSRVSEKSWNDIVADDLCLLVMVGVRAAGPNGLIALADGWSEVA
jgi:sugar lactone lactonase YvrE